MLATSAAGQEGAMTTDLTSRVETNNRAGTGLCLSGGGYRAMLFHVGSLRRLNELGWLPRLDFISSVSGGSITAAQLAMQWESLDFGNANEFVAKIEKPLRDLASSQIDLRATIGGLFRPRTTVNDRVVALLDKKLLHGVKLDELPDQPRFIFCATNLQTGSLMRFSKRYARDYQVASIEKPVFPLARVVAASAAFPPFLSPARLDVAANAWDQVEPAPEGVDPWPPRELVLSDGGVYDNLGLEPVVKRCSTILVSDGGGHMKYAKDVPNDWLRHLRRVLGVVDNQVRNLRKRQLIADFQDAVFAGTYWGIRTDILDYQRTVPSLTGVLPAPLTATRRLAAISTRLAPIKKPQQDQLINWGYAVTDAALRAHLNADNVPPAAFPSAGGVGQA
jgi:NTE family protein